MRGSQILRTLLLSQFLLGASVSQAAPSDDVASMAMMLSRFPAGTLPNSEPVRAAIEHLGNVGDNGEVSLLRHILRTERPELVVLAEDAVEKIHERTRHSQRKAFKRMLLRNDQRLANTIARQTEPVGPHERDCVAYAALVLGDSELVRVEPRFGDPKAFLRRGELKRALSAAHSQHGHRARMLESRIREYMGDLHGALTILVAEYAEGHQDAKLALESFGVNSERLLLGLLNSTDTALSETHETDILNVLIRRGSLLTISVLAERIQHPAGSERGIAADALAQMLEPSHRDTPLNSHSRRAAHRVLLQASSTPLEPARSIALEALHRTP